VSSTVSNELLRARQLLREEVREDQFQREIVHMAHLLGWRTYHTLNSRGAAAGFPDLTMVRGTRLVFAELKKEKGKATDAQQAWLDDLARVETVEARLWRPSDIDEVEGMLR
jgi:hypothetical protein